MSTATLDACSLPLRSRLGDAASWKALLAHHASIDPVDLRSAFAAEPGRAARCTAAGAGWTLDWSKQLMQPGTMPLLLELAREHLLELTQAEAFAPLYVRLAYEPA
jgi:chromatin segregation and condensation protein Rec8/ScpA/Scc1 (kleisin family)